jgi:hypothetical protein
VSFALLPLALIAGAYWYVTGGQVISTDDAYVEADKVGISTDVSGIVTEISVKRHRVYTPCAVMNASTRMRTSSGWRPRMRLPP